MEERVTCMKLCAHWLVIITFQAQTGKPLMRWCHLFMQACCLAYIYWLVLKREENMSSWEVYDESLITTEEQLLFSLITSSAVKLIPKMGNENDCCTPATIWYHRYVPTSKAMNDCSDKPVLMECNLTWLRVFSNPSHEFTVTLTTSTFLLYNMSNRAERVYRVPLSNRKWMESQLSEQWKTLMLVSVQIATYKSTVPLHCFSPISVFYNAA